MWTMKASPLGSSPSEKITSPRVERSRRDVANLTAHAGISTHVKWTALDAAMRPMILRFASLACLSPLLALFVMRSAAVPPAYAQQQPLGPGGPPPRQAGGGPRHRRGGRGGDARLRQRSAKVTPPVFRETGTGWFIEGDGWVVTNGHVIQPARETPRWLVNQQAQRAGDHGLSYPRPSRELASCPASGRRRRTPSSASCSTACCRRPRST